MKERQAAKGGFSGIELGGGGNHIGHGGFIEMGVRRQFGRSGGAAGMVDGGDVPGVDLAV